MLAGPGRAAGFQPEAEFAVLDLILRAERVAVGLRHRLARGQGLALPLGGDRPRALLGAADAGDIHIQVLAGVVCERCFEFEFLAQRVPFPVAQHLAREHEVRVKRVFIGQEIDGHPVDVAVPALPVDLRGAQHPGVHLDAVMLVHRIPQLGLVHVRGDGEGTGIAVRAAGLQRIAAQIAHVAQVRQIGLVGLLFAEAQKQRTQRAVLRAQVGHGIIVFQALPGRDKNHIEIRGDADLQVDRRVRAADAGPVHLDFRPAFHDPVDVDGLQQAGLIVPVVVAGPFDDGGVQPRAEAAVDLAGVVAHVPDDALDDLDLLAAVAALDDGLGFHHVPLHQTAALTDALPHAVGGARERRYGLPFAESVLHERLGLQPGDAVRRQALGLLHLAHGALGALAVDAVRPTVHRAVADQPLLEPFDRIAPGPAAQRALGVVCRGLRGAADPAGVLSRAGGVVGGLGDDLPLAPVVGQLVDLALVHVAAHPALAGLLAFLVAGRLLGGLPAAVVVAGLGDFARVSHAAGRAGVQLPPLFQAGCLFLDRPLAPLVRAAGRTALARGCQRRGGQQAQQHQDRQCDGQDLPDSLHRIFLLCGFWTPGREAARSEARVMVSNAAFYRIVLQL